MSTGARRVGRAVIISDQLRLNPEQLANAIEAIKSGIKLQYRGQELVAWDTRIIKALPISYRGSWKQLWRRQTKEQWQIHISATLRMPAEQIADAVWDGELDG